MGGRKEPVHRYGFLVGFVDQFNLSCHNIPLFIFVRLFFGVLISLYHASYVYVNR